MIPWLVLVAETAAPSGHSSKSADAAAATDRLAEAIRIVPNLLWIAVTVWIILYLYPKFRRDILPRLRTLKGFGVEAEFLEQKLEDASAAQNVRLPFGDRKRLLRRIMAVKPVFVGVRILWVDDIPENNAAERQLFETLGVTVITQQTSAAGLVAVRGQSFDVILSDMEREGKSTEGMTFAAAVHAEPRRPPVIIYTGTDQEGQSVPPFVFGITNRPDELVHLVIDTLERQRI